MMPAAFYLARYLMRPSLYEGDRMEERSCRWYGGDGKDESLAQEVPMAGDRCHAERV